MDHKQDNGMYSQNNEQEYILGYFKDRPHGRFLDIGAFDGVHLSNTRALFERGWDGTLVECSPTVFKHLRENYRDVDPMQTINLVDKAIGEAIGRTTFYDNPNAVATLVKDETNRWTDEVFEEVEVVMTTPEVLLENYPGPYNFISIDIEGMDLQVLRRLDLDALGCEMICVEHNGKILDKCRSYIEPFGFREVAINGENLIMAR